MKVWWLPGKVPEIQPKELYTRLSHGEQLQIVDPTRPVVTIRKTAHRSIPATQLLRSHGFTAMHLAKGMDEWRRQGLPLESS